jgi:tetratricopeptide (TPR) repeat protein
MAAYRGRLSSYRDLVGQRIPLLTQLNKKNWAAQQEANMAMFEALIGNLTEARSAALEASRMSTEWDVQGIAAVALAIAGDADGAQKLAVEMNQRFPEGTSVRFYYQPAIEAALALKRGNARKALERLDGTSSYDFLINTGMIAAYLRGLAHLAANQSGEAAADFQKILDNPTCAFTSSIALAHLGLGRAYALQRDMAKALKSYQDFMALWKDADPDIPILKQAKEEYAKLQEGNLP